LCTCEKTPPKIIHHKNSRKYKKKTPLAENIYHWYLCKVEERNDDFLMEGICAMPSQQIGNGLEEEWVLLNLNCEKCFDFEYTPQEGDNLIIKYSQKSGFLSFIFKNNSWVADSYNSFAYFSILKNKGKMKDILNLDLPNI
jgi:hypothetical protein